MCWWIVSSFSIVAEYPSVFKCSPQLEIEMIDIRWMWWSCDCSYCTYPFVMIDIIECILHWLATMCQNPVVHPCCYRQHVGGLYLRNFLWTYTFFLCGDLTPALHPRILDALCILLDIYYCKSLSLLFMIYSHNYNNTVK